MENFLHRVELRMAVLAAVALFIAQLGAMSHAYSHDGARGASTHQLGGASHDSCSDCLAYAPLLAVGGMPHALAGIAPQCRAPASRITCHSLVDLSLKLAFRARAPPRLAVAHQLT